MVWVPVTEQAWVDSAWADTTNVDKGWLPGTEPPEPPGLPLDILTATTATKIVKGSNLVLYDESWASFWNNWNWAGWIRPQIDHVATLGANTLRVFGSQGSLFGGTITQATYWSRWEQVVSYCASLGIRVYATFGDMNTGHWIASVSLSDNATGAGTWAALLEAQSNVIGIDIINEAFLADQYAMPNGQQWGLDCLNAMMTACHANSTIPVTQDRVATGPEYWPVATEFPNGIQALCDFHDWHCYHDGISASNISSFRGRGSWAASGTIVIGEFGANLDLTTQQRTARYTDTWTVVTGDQSVRGGIQWAAVDQGASTNLKWGLFDTSWVSRSDIAVPFANAAVTR